MSKSDLSPVTGEDKTTRTYLLFPYDPASGFAFYESEFDPGGHLEAGPHRVARRDDLCDCWELHLEVGDKSYTLATGEAIRFKADQRHEYSNHGRAQVEFTMVVSYPRRG